MLILKREDHYEGDVLSYDSIVTFGDKFQKDGSTIRNSWIKNGRYILLQFPISFIKHYIDPKSFEMVKGPCVATILFTRRTVTGDSSPKSFISWYWRPTYDD